MSVDENFFVDDNSQKGNFGIKEMLDGSQDERILWEGKPDKRSFVLGRVLQMMPFALIWLLFDGFVIGMIIAFATGLPWFIYLFFVVFFALHLTPVWIWIANVVSAFRRLKNTEYAFTDKRIIIKTGFFAKFDSVYYSDVASVNLHIGFIDRICKVGDVVIRTTAGDTYQVEDIKNPYFIIERLQKITMDIKTDMQYPNDLRPEENHGYNTKYKG